ncbi:MAG TPA: HDOD domain-containing protein [Bryobacteraceae bacterium]|nr:HDOD domain-containing protein [Bryobacteraceae bacterium]
MDVYVARQAIFDRSRNVYAYELLFRSAAQAQACEESDREQATAQVVANSLLSIGLENMLGGKKGFINFDREFLVSGFHSVLPRDSIVIEVLETVEADPEVVRICAELRQQGYVIALDDFVFRGELEPLIDQAQVIKVDLRVTSRQEQKRLLETYGPRGIAMLAEKVETIEEFDWARKAGYDLFQGYFFAQPVVVRGRQIPAGKVTCLQLLSEMQNAELNFDKLEQIIRQDVSLPFKLLLHANSAVYKRNAEVRSIRDALIRIGESGVRHWVVLAALPILAEKKPGELIGLSLVRASLCERIAKMCGVADYSQAFLMGLFSLLDAFIDLPLAEALGQVRVLPAVADALLGRAAPCDRLGLIYRFVKSYETGDWDSAKASSDALQIPPAMISRAYSEAVMWAQKALHATSRQKDARSRARHPLRGRIRLLLRTGDGQEGVINASLVNISANGLQIQVENAVPVGTSVHCNEASLGIAGRGSVRYCHPSKGKYLVGLDFANGTGWRDPLN